MRDVKGHKEAIQKRLRGRKKKIRTKLAQRRQRFAPVPAIHGKKEKPKKIVRTTARTALKQPAPDDAINAHYVGTYDASTNITAIDACVFAYREKIAPVWSYREYLHAVSFADTWRSQHEQYIARTEAHEHNKEETQRKYEHQQQMAWVRYSASDSEKAVFNEPYKVGDPPAPVLTLAHDQIDFAQRFNRSHYTPDEVGFLSYIKDYAPDLHKEITRAQPFYLSEDDRKMHTYIVGGSGSGKSELLKSLIYSYATQDMSSVVVLDPNGDFAEQVGRWHELATSNRLVYLEYDLLRGQSFTINPFVISGVPPADRSPDALATRIVVANQLQEAFIQIVSAGGGGDEFTINMKALLMPCITTLLEYPGATILDLQRFMNDEDNDDLIAFAKSLTHYPNNVTFFESEFLDKSYSPTKKAVAKKIRSLLNLPPFSRLTCGRNTVDLERALNEKKIIVFSLSGGAIGEAVMGAFGRLVVSMIQGIAVRRESVPRHMRVPCHLFIDECHNFISPSIEKILVEARKYALHLTMAQQAVGYKMSTELKKILGINTVVKISGKMPVTAWNDTASYIGTDAHLFDSLMDAKGRYICSSAGSPPVVVAGRDDLLDEKNCVDAPLWHQVKKTLCATYYRNYAEQESVTSPPPVEEGAPAQNDPQDRLDFDIG